MGTNLGSLGDFFRQTGTEQHCRIRGCKNMVTVSNEQALFNKATGKSKNDGGKMCDSCWEYLKTLQDIEVPCSKPGCTGKWIWNRYQQLEAHVNGHDTPPKGFCEECRGHLKEKQDKQQPCRTRGCKNTWTWTTRMQMESKDGKPPHRLCDDCHKIWITLEDKELPCRVKGCKNHILWTKTQQLEWIRSGNSKDEVPKRMCKECLEKYSLLKPVEVPCRVNGCQHTWTWTPFEQLEAVVGIPMPAKTPAPQPEQKNEQPNTETPAAEAETKAAPAAATAPAAEVEAKAAPAAEATPVQENTPAAKPVTEEHPFKITPPKRMCRECYKFFESAKDQEQPCANRGCDGKWLWTRSMQLAGHVHGHDQPGHRICDKCQEELKTLKTIKEPCKETDCHGTWEYLPEDQLKDKLQKRQPQGRHCPECSKFLRENKPQELTCEKCGAKFTWSVQEQLLTKLGTYNKPTCCANCNTEALAASAPPPPLIIPASQTAFKIEMPVGGPWIENHITRDWPAGLTSERIADMEKADNRIVFIGDDLVADQTGFPSLTSLLEASLNSSDTSCAVLNAGICGCTTALGTARIGRDVAPFAPHTVIFSFAFADANKRTEEPQSDQLARLSSETEAFLDALQALEKAPNIICWLPNPIYPQRESNLAWKTNADPDTIAAAHYNAILRNLKNICDKRNVTVANGKAVFDILGQKTAMDNMASWCRANAEGCKAHLRAILEAMKQ